METIIDHNPDCGTERNVLAVIRQSGIEPRVIEYLKAPPSRALLRPLLREEAAPDMEPGLGDQALAEDRLVDATVAHPKLTNRPAIVSPKGRETLPAIRGRARSIVEAKR